MITVRELRRSKLWTQDDLARRAQVAVQTIHRIEEGCSVLPITAEAVARALGVQREEIADLKVIRRVK